MVLAADVSKWIGEVLLEDIPGHIAVDITGISVGTSVGASEYAQNTFQWHVTLYHRFGESFHTLIPDRDMTLLHRVAVHVSMIRLMDVIVGYLRERDRKRGLLTSP